MGDFDSKGNWHYGETGTEGSGAGSPTTSRPRSTAPTARETSVRSQANAAGVVLIPFYYSTVSASATDTAMLAPGLAAAFPRHVPFRGSIVAIEMLSSSTKTAGTMTITATVNAVATTATHAWVTDTQHGASTMDKGSVAFDANDYLALTFTTDSGFLPANSVVSAGLWVQVDQQSVI